MTDKLIRTGSEMKKESLHMNQMPRSGPDTVKTDLLVPIAYEYRRRRDIDIEISQPEFTSVCPMTGLPDFGTVTVKYRPGDKIIELKSLKYYFLQYRNVGIFYEHAVNRILDDLVAVLSPKRMEVIGNFTARGGIATRVTAIYEGEN
ncbi:MAG: preQ(1) synthase [Desulfococcaceae bacterium]